MCSHLLTMDQFELYVLAYIKPNLYSPTISTILYTTVYKFYVVKVVYDRQCFIYSLSTVITCCLFTSCLSMVVSNEVHLNHSSVNCMPPPLHSSGSTCGTHHSTGIQMIHQTWNVAATMTISQWNHPKVT